MTDHKAEAEASLYAAWGSRADVSAAEIFLAEAQVQALLGVAKQQRVTNLIAMAQFSYDAGGGERLYTNIDASIEWRAQAAEELGLEA